MRPLCGVAVSAWSPYAPPWSLASDIKEAVMADLFYGALALGLFALFGGFVAALRRV